MEDELKELVAVEDAKDEMQVIDLEPEFPESSRSVLDWVVIGLATALSTIGVVTVVKKIASWFKNRKSKKETQVKEESAAAEQTATTEAPKETAEK